MIYSLQWRKSRVVPHNNNKLSNNLEYWIIWESYIFIKHEFWIFFQYLFSVCNKRNRIIILMVKFMKANVINYWSNSFLMWYQWLFAFLMTCPNYHENSHLRFLGILKSDFLRALRIGRQSRKIKFFFILPKHTFGWTYSRKNSLKFSPFILWEKFRKVQNLHIIWVFAA